MLYELETRDILSAFYEVYNKLGYGFLEQVYQNAFYKELLRRDIPCVPQQPINVYYKGELVGKFVADIVVDDTIILELKAVSALKEEHEVQLVNYLKATGIEVGLLLNFGKKPEFKRKIFSAEYQESLKSALSASSASNNESVSDNGSASDNHCV